MGNFHLAGVNLILKCDQIWRETVVDQRFFPGRFETAQADLVSLPPKHSIFSHAPTGVGAMLYF